MYELKDGKFQTIVEGNNNNNNQSVLITSLSFIRKCIYRVLFEWTSEEIGWAPAI